MTAAGALFLTIVLTVGCSSAEHLERSAEQVFDRMERALLGQDHIEFTVESSGAFESSFEGWMSRQTGELAMAAHGTWGSEPVVVSAETTRELLVLNTPTQVERLRREPFIATAVGVGLVRMGILHNLARLIDGKGPDHADGGVRDWVTAENIRFVNGGRDTVRFDILVDGEKSGVATVRVDPDSGLPVHRTQTVDFAAGSMTVVETYRY